MFAVITDPAPTIVLEPMLRGAIKDEFDPMNEFFPTSVMFFDTPL